MSEDGPEDWQDDGAEPPDDVTPYLHLVVADDGDYEDRRTWVAFATFEVGQAEKRVAEKKAEDDRRREAVQGWLAQAHKVQRELLASWSAGPKFQDAYREWFDANPMPPSPEGAHYTVVTIPLDTWGQWGRVEA